MNRKEELKKAYLAGFVEGGIIKTLKGIKYHLIIEDMADEYAEQQINLTIPIVGVSLKIPMKLKKSLIIYSGTQ